MLNRNAVADCDRDVCTDLLLNWTPADGPVDWARHYKWVPILPRPPRQPRLKQAPYLSRESHDAPVAPAPDSTAPLPARGTRAPLDSTPHRGPSQQVHAPPLASNLKSPTPSSERPHPCNTLQPPPGPLEPEERAEGDVDENEQAERAAAQNARDKRWLDEYATQLAACQREPDPSVGLKLWQGCLDDIAARLASEREEEADRAARLRDRSPGPGPVDVEVRVKAEEQAAVASASEGGEGEARGGGGGGGRRDKGKRKAPGWGEGHERDGQRTRLE